MAAVLELPIPDLAALAAGRTVVAFAERHAVDINDEVELIPSGARARAELQEQYAPLAEAEAPEGEWSALVVGLQPASSLGRADTMQHHILAEVPDGDVVILRVYGPEGAVLSDETFADEQLAVAAAFQ